MSDLPKPKPCPFCGHSEIGVVEGESFRYCRSMCAYCGAQSPEVRKDTMADDRDSAESEAHARAIEEWNTRADLLPIIEALEKTTDFIRTWADCLAGVQMSKESFIKDCGLIEAKTALSAYRGKK